MRDEADSKRIVLSSLLCPRARIALCLHTPQNECTKMRQSVMDWLLLIHAPATVEKSGTIRLAIPWQPGDTIAVPNLHKERPFHVSLYP